MRKKGRTSNFKKKKDFLERIVKKKHGPNDHYIKQLKVNRLLKR